MAHKLTVVHYIHLLHVSTKKKKEGFSGNIVPKSVSQITPLVSQNKSMNMVIISICFLSHDDTSYVFFT